MGSGLPLVSRRPLLGTPPLRTRGEVLAWEGR